MTKIRPATHIKAAAADQALIRQLEGYSLATAEIFYHMPDHPHLLQTFVYQLYDIAPDYPELNKFLEFWRKKIEGPIHSVQVTSLMLITPGKWRYVSEVIH